MSGVGGRKGAVIFDAGVDPGGRGPTISLKQGIISSVVPCNETEFPVSPLASPPERAFLTSDEMHVRFFNRIYARKELPSYQAKNRRTPQHFFGAYHFCNRSRGRICMMNDYQSNRLSVIDYPACGPFALRLRRIRFTEDLLLLNLIPARAVIGRAGWV